MTKHADASPSSSSTWIKCPASVTKARGRVRVATSYTREGTAAHAAAELLVKGIPVPAEMEIEGETIEISDEMVETLELYVEYLETLRATCDVFLTEQKVSLDYLPEPIFGTADCIAYSRVQQTLTVPDLKYGKGWKVDVGQSNQSRIYALGAMRSLEKRGEDVRWVTMAIVQPRIDGLDSVTVEADDLKLWEIDVLWPATERLAKNDQTENPGNHCRWCVRSGECRAFADLAVSEAKLSFDPVDLLTSDELSAILKHAELIQFWVNQVRAEASQRLDKGEKIPGWKLVAKRAMRKWIDDVAALQKLVIDLNIPANEVTKIVTVAAAERALKAHKIAPTPVLKPLVVQESSGTTLVRDSDSRPDAMDATRAFAAITSEATIGTDQ